MYILNLLFSVHDSDNSLIVKACGTVPPPVVVSSSNSLTLNFKTDGSRNATGFKAYWTIDTVNSITSPDYPKPFQEDNDEVKVSNVQLSINLFVFSCSFGSFLWMRANV